MLAMYYYESHIEREMAHYGEYERYEWSLRNMPLYRRKKFEKEDYGILIII